MVTTIIGRNKSFHIDSGVGNVPMDGIILASIILWIEQDHLELIKLDNDFYTPWVCDGDYL